MSEPTVAIIAMGGEGQYQRLRPLIASLRDRDITVWVFTDSGFEGEVQRLGGYFADLFADRPLSSADDASRPITCRYVSFAGRFADEIAREVAAVRPSVVMADTYAMVGLVVARILDVPYVNVCHGADVDPARFAAQLEADPRLHLAPECLQAIDVLRERHGFQDASPTSFLTNQSALLNIYFEPEQYLSDDTRRAFDPIAFFGSLPSAQDLDARQAEVAPRWFGSDDGKLNVFVSFGTLVWGVFSADRRWSSAADAVAAVQVLSDAFAARPDIRGLITLGRANLDADVIESLRKPNVRVERYVDQWQVLDQADVFVTHHGMNSTHEAIFHEVPMISYPFFWDHPPLAEKCQALGLALPLTAEVRAPVTEELVDAAIDECLRGRETMSVALARAREWELDLVPRRHEIVDRIVGLI